MIKEEKMKRREPDVLIDVENAVSITEQERENLIRMNEDALQSLEATQKSQEEQELLSLKYDRGFLGGSKNRKRWK